MIREIDVDGVPTLFAERSGPLRAGLMFRVGRADERLARSGITHLVEHLALYRQANGDLHQNGETSSAFTQFLVTGSGTEVVDFLAGVCEALGDLPMDRLDAERSVLRTEAAGTGTDDMAAWRYGARGFGLPGFNELGLGELEPRDLVDWVATWFTRDNAVLWIAGSELPAGLRLPLPAGTRKPFPAITSALPQCPAYFPGGSGSVEFTGVVRDCAAAQVFATVLSRELFRSLRRDGGYSYTAQAAYEPRGDGFGTVRAVADALADKQDAVLGGFIDVLAGLAAGRMDPAEITALVTAQSERLADANAEAAMLPGHAALALCGQPLPGVDELSAELAAVTPERVHEVARAAMGSGLLRVPSGRAADWAGYTQAPVWSTQTVAGTRYPAGNQDGTLILGPTGASVVKPSGVITVRYDECVAQMRWPDGARWLIGADALVLRIEPTLFKLSAEAETDLDSRLDPETVVQMRPRERAEIPMPRPHAPRRNSHPWMRTPAAPVTYRRQVLGVAVMLGIEVLMFALGVWNIVILVSAHSTQIQKWFVVIGLYVLLAFIARASVPVVRDFLRARRAHRRL